MRTTWRRSQEVNSHADWIGRIEAKNRRIGTSAPTLAALWAGPVELAGAVRGHDALRSFAIKALDIEVEASVDEYAGRGRHHDLVVRGVLDSGARVVVCVEAKAGESLGQSVSSQRKSARAAAAENPRSKALDRIDGLVQRLVIHRDPERVGALRYQLLTGLEGTISEAERESATHAVFFVHDIVTDQRPDRSSDKRFWDLNRFSMAVFDQEIPPLDRGPWCVEVPAPAGAGFALYLAYARTDLRTVALES